MKGTGLQRMEIDGTRMAGSRSSLFLVAAILVIAFATFPMGVALAQEPAQSDSYYHFSIAQFHLLNEDYEEAVKELDKAAEIDPSSSEIRTELAKALTQVHKVSRAIEECEKAVKLDPENAEAHYVLGRIFLGTSVREEGREKALKQFEKVIELDPRHMGALMDAADMYWEKRDFESAAKMFAGMRQVNPTYIHAYYSQAQALNELGKYQEAIEVLEDGLRLRDDLPEYLTLLVGLYKRVGTPEKGVPLLKKALESGPNPALERALAMLLIDSDEGEAAIPLLRDLVGKYPAQLGLMKELGRAYRQARRLEEAARTFEVVLKTDPTNVEVNYELANVYAVMGEREKAIAKFRMLAEMVGEDATRHRDVFLSQLGLLYEQQGEYEKAVDAFREIARRSPDDAEANLRLYYALKQAERYQEALELTSKMVQKHPSDPFVLIAYGQALADAKSLAAGIEFLDGQIAESESPELLYIASSQIYLAQEAYSEAQKVIEKGLGALPESEQLRFQLGAVYERQKEFDQAEVVFKKILDDNPDHADVLNYLGYMLAERGVRLNEALDYLQRAVKIDPYNGAYLDSLGWAYYQKDDLDEAEVHLTKAASLNSLDPTILEHLGDLYSKKGEVDKAREYYEKSLENAEKEDEEVRVKSKLSQLR